MALVVSPLMMLVQRANSAGDFNPSPKGYDLSLVGPRKTNRPKILEKDKPLFFFFFFFFFLSYFGANFILNIAIFTRKKAYRERERERVSLVKS
jgi:hypothetical protein